MKKILVLPIDKVCTCCKETKARSSLYFNKHRGRPDGLQTSCKLCVKKYQQENPHIGKKSNQKYRSIPANKEKMKNTRRAWVAANKEYVKKFDACEFASYM